MTISGSPPPVLIPSHAARRKPTEPSTPGLDEAAAAPSAGRDGYHRPGEILPVPDPRSIQSLGRRSGG